MNDTMSYRKLFVKCEKKEYSNFVNVTNDGWHVSSFLSEASTQGEFNQDCEVHLDSDVFKKNLVNQRGY